MDRHAGEFRQPIATAESPVTGSPGERPYEGNSRTPKGVRPVMGQPRYQAKPTSHSRCGMSTLR